MLLQKMLVSLNPSGLQQHPAVSQAEPAPCACSHSLQNVSVTCRPARSCVSCSPPCTQHKGTSAAVGLCLKKAKQRGLVSILHTDQSEQHLQITSEAFNVLTGGPERVQAPEQAMDSPKWAQGVAVSHWKAVIQSSSKWCND